MQPDNILVTGVCPVCILTTSESSKGTSLTPQPKIERAADIYISSKSHHKPQPPEINPFQLILLNKLGTEHHEFFF